MENDSALPQEAMLHYAGGLEVSRLGARAGLLELVRTQAVIARRLPSGKMTILDVGGGPGAHALWLASLGHEVHLIDAVPLHVEQALASSAAQERRLAGASVGDARRLEQADSSMHAVLMLGPLYHLTDRSDRIAALREAWRVLRPGGLIFAAGISRFASLLDGLFGGLLEDPSFARIVEADLRDGQHRNPGDHPRYFTTAFFNHPDELAGELSQAGFALEELAAVEGAAWLLEDLDSRLADPQRRRQLLDLLEAVQHEPSLLGVSAHLLAVGRRLD